MANILKRSNSASHSLEKLNFRLLRMRDGGLEGQEPEAQGFTRDLYRCAHGHQVRDSEHHWCEACVRKITSNVCGLDINYLDISYRTSAVVNLLLSLPVHLGPDACWPMPSATDRNKRLILPGAEWKKTTRAQKYSCRKAIYTLFWGDIGKARVTRNTPPHGNCTDPDCCNPLHMVSLFNTQPTPRDFAYLDLEVSYNKLAKFQQFFHANVPLENFWETLAKPRIRDPKMDADVLMERTYCTHAEARKTIEVQSESTPEAEVSE
ncbi:MAG TPA: hypothetical protein DCW74_08830 [Alteromonas australica]|uniref:Uncharacterized protein n=1 Tax=Alteromonas australica TaxID=589873 RepID=A0A350P3F7_9ALTE|nr:hypothetical protein [Alteromonas australica]